MELTTLEKIARESAGRVARIKVVGLGEAALHPELDAMLRCLRHFRLSTTLYTNGTLFERFSHRDIAQWGLARIVVSVDGIDEPSFKRLRLGGDYAAVKENVRSFRAMRDGSRDKTPIIEIRHVIMPSETDEQLRGFRREWTADLGDTVKFNLLGPPFERRAREDPGRPPCRDIRRELHIRYDGLVPLCGYSGDREWIGDVTTQAVKDVWIAPRLGEVRSMHERCDYAQLPFCKTCQHR